MMNVRSIRSHASILALLVFGAVPASAHDSDLPLVELSLEELLDTEVFSVSREDRDLMSTAAAVTVLTREDLRRSGARSVAEALRLVPGMHVSRINSSAWAISARGFAGRLANKMLVMVDGRSVYSPTFSGVHWETLDLVFEDIEQIEVVRGPGGTMWGTNAMNGVVNIITRDARDTHGSHVASGGGSQVRGAGSFRLGGGDDRRSWRVYAKGTQQQGFDRIDGGNSDGALDLGQVGLRLDRRLNRRTEWTIQGDLYRGSAEESIGATLLTPPYSVPMLFDSELHGSNLLSVLRVERAGRWTLRSYFDDSARESDLLDEHRFTFDVDLQHALTARGHSLMWGLGWRHQKANVADTRVITFVGPEHRSQWTAFLQDRKGFADDRLQVICGVKVEDHTSDRPQWQPSLRASWSPSASRTTWAALSRAVRAPSSLERDISGVLHVNPPSAESMGLPLALQILPAHDAFKSERMVATEFGHREQLGVDWQVDLTLYHQSYEGFRAYALLDPVVELGGPNPYVTQPIVSANALDAEVSGVELGLAWQAHEAWRLRTNYSLTAIDLWPRDRSLPLLEGDWHSEEDSTPLHQLQLVSWMALGSRWEFDQIVTAYGRNHGQDVAPWVRLDARLGWRMSPELELSVVGQNLLRTHHFEWAGNLDEVRNYPGRTIYVGIEWSRD